MSQGKKSLTRIVYWFLCRGPEASDGGEIAGKAPINPLE